MAKPTQYCKVKNNNNNNLKKRKKQSSETSDIENDISQFSSVTQSCPTMSIKLMIPSNHLILWHPLLLLPPIPPSFRVFSNESTLHMMCTKYWQLWQQSIDSALAPVIPMNTQDLSPLGWTGWISLQSKGLSRVFSNTTGQKHQFFSAQLFSQSNSHNHT